MPIDRFLGWINVQIMTLDEELQKTKEGKGKRHDIYVKIHELKLVRDSYNRIKGDAV